MKARAAAFILVIPMIALALLLAPLTPEAQQAGKIPRIGILAIGTGTTPSPAIEALRRGLGELGWIEGQNIIIEYRSARRVEELPDLAAELVRMKVDLIFAGASTQVEPARQATKTIPIVFASHADPVGVGHVASLARPGGNITGLAQLLTELSAKELELLKTALPHAGRIGVLWNPTTPSHPPALKAVAGAAEKLGVQLHMVAAQNAEEFDAAFSTMVRDRVGAFLVIASPLTYIQRGRLAEVALKYRLPGMFAFRENTDAGGLMSYGPDINDLYRRAATYVDKILKGAKPADLPVEQAQKFDLVINLKTARALGLTIPQSLLLRADHIIE